MKAVRILKHTSSIIVRTITATLFFNVHKRMEEAFNLFSLGIITLQM